MDARLKLHSDFDVGLKDQERKLTLLKETIDEFLKEFKARLKEPGTKDLVVKHWLNSPNSRFTSFVCYNLDKDGNGQISFSDCHKNNITWVYQARDEKGKVKSGHYSSKQIQMLEDVSKGLGKSIRAIQQLRKFFEREVFDTSE